jgi:hypothetical protein
VLKWAAERSGIGSERLYRLFPNWDAWIDGEKHPTVKQVEGVARATHTPVGFFYLPEPVTIDIPIPDFRRMASEERGAASPDLLDVIHASQLRQAWYHDHVRSESTPPLPFVGSVTIADDALEAAEKLRASLDFSEDERRGVHTFADMLRACQTLCRHVSILACFSFNCVELELTDTHPQGDSGLVLPDHFDSIRLIADLYCLSGSGRAGGANQH